ncbi:hypothetical protein KAS06_01495 [Candidatus Bathyarchaeota archaeon]|nr:hypothetical protein [Candidatus Bathyarchaeota archaeon]
MSTTFVFLPFVVKDSSRKKPFSENMEVAALLCLAESERTKKSGIFGRSEETLIVLSRLNYPLWAVPFDGASLLIDGMETISASILYFKPPDIEAFIEHLRRCTTVHELYCSALRSHIETFSRFTSKTEIPIKGLITNKESLSDILNFIQDRKTSTQNSTGSGQNSLVPPKINLKTAVDIAKRVSEHFRRFQAEIKGLRLAIETIDKETKTHTHKLSQEQKQIQEEFESKISKMKVEVDKRNAESEEEKTGKIEKVTATHEKEVDARLAEKKKWERELLKWEQRKSEYEKRKEMRKRKGDDIGIARWNVRLRNTKDQISTSKGKIKALSAFIDRNNRELERAKKKILDNYRTQLNAAEGQINDLESKKESEILKKQREINELQRDTTTIINKIERLIRRKQDSSATIEEASIQWKIKTPILIHLPFYLVCYKSTGKERRRLHLPALAREREGLAMKIRKTLRRHSLRSKINNLLKPRSKALEKILEPFKEAAQANKGIGKVLNRLGESRNLLVTEWFKKMVIAGMNELEAEGWIKPEEKIAILKTYVPK